MLKLMQAGPEDYDFMRKEIMLGARNRHFVFTAKKPADIQIIEENIRLAIQYQRFTSGLKVLPILFMKNHTRVGMVMMSELGPGEGGNEIHLVFVSHKHRGMGYGSQMIDSILAQRAGVEVFARCAPASQLMYEMLERRGFAYQYTMADGFRVLLRPKQTDIIDLTA